MLVHTVNHLTQWIVGTGVGSSMATMIRDYLLAQDTKTMVSCTPANEPALVEIATAQDILGWDSFVEGRITTNFLTAVKPALTGRRRRLKPKRWCQQFISKLLQITHKQWLYRNSDVHYKKLEGMTARRHEDIIAQMQDLMWTDPHELLDQHRSLLEADFEALGDGTSGDRLQWISSINSAKKAATYIRSGGKYMGNPGTDTRPLQHTNTT